MYVSFVKMQMHRRILVIFLILLLLSGCDQSFSYHKPQKTAVPALSGRKTAIPVVATPLGASPGPAPLGTSVSFNLGGWIHIQSASGFTCGALPGGPPGLLVLPTVQPTYDQGTLQSVQNYVTTLYQDPGDIGGTSGDTPHHRDTVPYPAFSANPNAFQLQAGGYGECDEFLQVTSISHTLVQVNPVSVTLTADTQSNTQHYNLIDECSLLSPPIPCRPQLGGSSSLNEIYFDLHPGKKDTVIPASTEPGFGDNSFDLSPGEVAEVVLVYVVVEPSHLSFSLLPSFRLGLPGEQPTTYPVPQLQETFAFALASQFSCYRLQGQHFVKLTNLAQDDVWCI